MGGRRKGPRSSTAAKTVRDLRVAEVVRQDVTIGDGGVVNFRVRLGISFKYDSGESPPGPPPPPPPPPSLP